MHYLSRMPLNPRRRGTAKFLSAPQTMHAALESSFPPHNDGGNPRTLWRLERIGDKVTLWVVSERKPSFEPIAEQAGWPNSGHPTWETRDYTLLLDRLMTGQRYQFRLTANPVLSRRNEKNKQQRIPLVKEDQQIRWLLDRAPRLGFSAGDDTQPTFMVTKSQRYSFKHENSSGVSLLKCQFDGVLTVTDPTLLYDALTKGVGKGKAYGLGLLTLAPYRG